jgi:hypothetical protein
VKVLLDENLDHALRKLLGLHEVFTVTFMGWTGLKNGELLRAAEEMGIEVLVTGDRTLNYEQNLAGRRLAIAVLSAIQCQSSKTTCRRSSPLSIAPNQALIRRWSAGRSAAGKSFIGKRVGGPYHSRSSAKLSGE